MAKITDCFKFEKFIYKMGNLVNKISGKNNAIKETEEALSNDSYMEDLFSNPQLEVLREIKNSNEKSSKEANRLSKIAILIAILSLIVSSCDKNQIIENPQNQFENQISVQQNINDADGQNKILHTHIETHQETSTTVTRKRTMKHYKNKKER